MTVYAPGVSVEEAKISITRDTFSMEAALGDKTVAPDACFAAVSRAVFCQVDIEFEFREDVDPDDIMIEPWHWLAGRKPDSIMFQIPKVISAC